jgi:hypothetical protein
MYFMSDGSAAYPTAAVSSIKGNRQLVEKIEFDAVAFGG